MPPPPDIFPLEPGDTVRWRKRGEYMAGRFVRWTTRGNAVVEFIDEDGRPLPVKPGLVKPADLRPSNDGRTVGRRGCPLYWKDGRWTTILEVSTRRR